MIKRTKGRLLLALLVITGLAGTIRSTSLNKQERKYAVLQLKDTRAELLRSVKGLSEAQLNFRPGPNKQSVRDCVFHITTVENSLWGLLDNVMKFPSAPEKRELILDSDLGMFNNTDSKNQQIDIAEKLQPDNESWLNTADALNHFKEMRNEQLKYTKTTTEDMRNHVVEMPFGSIDSYQLILFIAGHTNRHIQEIEAIKADPNFPKN